MWIFYSLLASISFASINIIDSIFIHKYEKDPCTFLWVSSMVRIWFTLSIPFMWHIEVTHVPQLLLAGGILFIVSIVYVSVMSKVDTSVVQSAWALESIILSILGIFVLGESWSLLQLLGAMCILGGVFLLSYWHKHISVVRTLFLLLLLAVLASPTAFIQKLVLNDGVSVITVLFWYMLARDIAAIIFPVFHKKTRKNIWVFIKKTPTSFYNVLSITTLITLCAFWLSALAYQNGPLSLVSILGNVQPFLVILLAWALQWAPSIHPPKELLSKQSVSIKLTSFTIVFIGLAFLVVE